MEFLRLFRKCHLAGKQVVTLPNVGSFLNNNNNNLYLYSLLLKNRLWQATKTDKVYLYNKGTCFTMTEILANPVKHSPCFVFVLRLKKDACPLKKQWVRWMWLLLFFSHSPVLQPNVCPGRWSSWPDIVFWPLFWDLHVIAVLKCNWTLPCACVGFQGLTTPQAYSMPKIYKVSPLGMHLIFVALNFIAALTVWSTVQHKVLTWSKVMAKLVQSVCAKLIGTVVLLLLRFLLRHPVVEIHGFTTAVFR